jgi:serine protease Do
MVRVVLRHLTGARAAEADVLDIDAASEVVLGPDGALRVQLDPPRGDPLGRWQARIIPVEGNLRRFVLVDLGSKAGIFVNHRRVADAVLLRPGDVIQLGEQGAEIEFRIEGTLL